MTSRVIKDECVMINKVLSDAIFSFLINAKQINTNLDVYSYKVFISNAFEYICTREKKASNIEL